MAILRLTAQARNRMLEALRQAFDSVGPATMEIYSGQIPVNPSFVPEQARLLSVHRLSHPCGPPPEDATLRFDRIEPDWSARASGKPQWARIIDGGGVPVAVFDAGTAGTVVIVKEEWIDATAPVAITSFQLSIGG